MAHIEKRGPGRWRARYRDPNGKERSKTFERKVDAERWLTTKAAEMMSGTYIGPDAGRTTLGTYAAEWLARMAPTWRVSTAAGITNSLEHHILPVLGRRPVPSIRRSDIEALCAALRLAPSTVATVHQHLGQLLASAVEDGLIARNPAVRARLPKREASKAQPVPLDVVERIHAGLPDWMAVAVPIGIGAGLRQGEASGLTVDRLDFLRRTLRVDRQLLCRHVPAPVLGPPKTESSHRTIPLASFLRDALADHLRRHPAGPGELVLRSPAGQPLDADRFGHQWRRACRAAGVPGLRYHDLRHTFASTLLSRGVSVKAVADWLGHASPTITLATYAHLMPADEEVARAVLDDALAPPAASPRPTTGTDLA
jgi:integrase